MLARRSFVLAAGGLALSRLGQVNAQRAVVQIGVVPNVSPRVIVANYQPLRRFLEDLLRRPVDIVTAPNFKVFHERTLKGEYDLVVTAPHMGRLAQVDGGLQPLVCYEPNVGGLLVTDRKTPAKSIDALRGQSLALANPQSLVVMQGMRWLESNKLKAGVDYTLLPSPNQDSLARAVLSGQARFAMLSTVELKQVQDSERDQLVLFERFVELPGFYVLAHPKLASEFDPKILRARLMGFPASSDGEAFKTATGVTGMREISSADTRLLDSVLPQTRAALQN